jgi:hypothetical protein
MFIGVYIISGMFFSSFHSLGRVVNPRQNTKTYIYPPFTTSLTGTDVTYSSGVYVLAFKENGTMAFRTDAILPTTVNYLLVGGGGTGSVGANSGGGGAGGSVIQIQAGGAGVISIQDLIKTFTFTVAASVAGPNTGSQNLAGFTGNSTILAITGGSTHTAAGGAGGTSAGLGGIGANGGGSGGNKNDGVGSNGTNVIIRSVEYYFGGGGSGGNYGGTGNPKGGLGGGGGAGGGGFGNNGVIYNRPNGISQTFGSAGFANSGGGGAGNNGNTNNTFSARAGGSGVVIVYFTYP